jgi:hypothetical protein
MPPTVLLSNPRLDGHHVRSCSIAVPPNAPEDENDGCPKISLGCLGARQGSPPLKQFHVGCRKVEHGFYRATTHLGFRHGFLHYKGRTCEFHRECDIHSIVQYAYVKFLDSLFVDYYSFSYMASNIHRVSVIQ